MTPNLELIFDRKGQASRDKEGVIELKISGYKQRTYMSTGIRVYPKEWKNGAVVGRKDFKELNDQLQAIKRKCSEVIIRMMEDDSLEVAAIPKILKNEMYVQSTFLDYAEAIAKKQRYQKVSPGTREHYLHWFRFMRSWKGIVSFADVNERNITALDNHLRKMGLKEVSRWSYHKILKTFILQAMNDGLLKSNPYMRLDIKKAKTDGLTRFLTHDEFKKFATAKIADGKLARVRDLFVFQTYTMMSYQDLAKFDKRKCTNVDGNVVYKANRIKTGQEFVVVIIEPALEILKKYHGRLPIISNVKYNAYLKVAAMYAGVDKPITTHWARHTGATLLLNDGMPIHIIQHILGHSSIRETEKTYAKLMDKTIIESMSQYHHGM